MAPSSKSAESRRKSGAKTAALTVTLRVSPSSLRELLSPASRDERSPTATTSATNTASATAQEPKDVKESLDSKGSPTTPNALAASAKANSNGENASDSNAATPAAEGTPAPSVMGPPTEGAKKKGVKRSAAAANGATDGAPKARGRPGPKKKAKLDDGTGDASGSGVRQSGGHKLGPKANQGAINAGLRALDRSGKPCRRWNKGGFKLKSFTGVLWEIPRWTAPPRKMPESSTEESAAPSAESSSKENKDQGNEGNSVTNSNSGADVEMHSVLSMQASSPAPIAVAAAS